MYFAIKVSIWTAIATGSANLGEARTDDCPFVSSKQPGSPPRFEVRFGSRGSRI